MGDGFSSGDNDDDDDNGVKSMNETNKSILVMETPSSCVMCPLSVYNVMYDEYMCQGTDNYNRTIETYGDKPSWCPLTVLPSHKDLTKYIMRGDTRSMTHLVQYIHDQGFNDCLDDITKKGKTK